ncbi:MAG: hypothetical protein ACRDV4_02500 [Acidimicrobiales bacterium]
MRAAIAANDEAQASELRRRLRELGEKDGAGNPRDFLAWDPERALEVAPGVFVQDERPVSTGV